MKFYRLSDATFYDCINTIYQFIKPFLDKKCLFLRNMEPLKIEVPRIGRSHEIQFYQDTGKSPGLGLIGLNKPENMTSGIFFYYFMCACVHCPQGYFVLQSINPFKSPIKRKI